MRMKACARTAPATLFSTITFTVASAAAFIAFGIAVITPVKDAAAGFSTAAEHPIVSRLDIAANGSVTISTAGAKWQEVLLESAPPGAAPDPLIVEQPWCLETINLATDFAASCLTLTFDSAMSTRADYILERDFREFLAPRRSAGKSVSALEIRPGGSISIVITGTARPGSPERRTIFGSDAGHEIGEHHASTATGCPSLNIPGKFVGSCLAVTFATPTDKSSNEIRRITDIPHLNADLGENRLILEEQLLAKSAPQRNSARALADHISALGIAAFERANDVVVVNVDIDSGAREDLVREFFARNRFVLKHLEENLPGADDPYARYRRGRLLVPRAEFDVTRERLLDYWFISSVAEDRSDYRLACERHGGVVKYHDRTIEYCTGLPLPEVDWQHVQVDGREECGRVNGSWATYPTTCTGSCSFEASKLCGDMVTQACDCGPGQCWARNPGRLDRAKGTCVETPNWHGQWAR